MCEESTSGRGVQLRRASPLSSAPGADEPSDSLRTWAGLPGLLGVACASKPLESAVDAGALQEASWSAASIAAFEGRAVDRPPADLRRPQPVVLRGWNRRAIVF